jgi:hypothetical protein
MLPFRLLRRALVCTALLLLNTSRIHACEITEVFTANPPYSPSVADVAYHVDLAGSMRRFELAGNSPFINQLTGVTDFATINVWDPEGNKAVVITSNKVNANGVRDRIFKKNEYTAIGYVKGDGVVEGKLRAQINSFPIPSRQRFLWDLNFRLGEANLGSPWTFTEPGLAPATLWQLKTVDLPPSVVMAVDTDVKDNTKLMLNFDLRLNPYKPAVRLGDVSGINPSSDIIVQIDSYLDERPLSEGGRGFLKIMVNGRSIIDWLGPVLQKSASRPYNWSFGMYLYSNVLPLDFDRFSYWKRANMLSCK